MILKTKPQGNTVFFTGPIQQGHNKLAVQVIGSGGAWPSSAVVEIKRGLEPNNLVSYSSAVTFTGFAFTSDLAVDAPIIAAEVTTQSSADGEVEVLFHTYRS